MPCPGRSGCVWPSPWGTIERMWMTPLRDALKAERISYARHFKTVQHRGPFPVAGDILDPYSGCLLLGIQGDT